MKTNDRDLKNRYKAYIRTKSSDSRRKCPSREDLAKAFDPKTGKMQKTRIIDHLSVCHHCTEEFETLRQIFNASRDMAIEVDGILSKESGSGASIRKVGRVVNEMRRPFSVSITRFASRYLTWVAAMIIVITGIVLISRWPGFLFQEHKVRGPEKAKILLHRPGEGSRIHKPVNSKPGDFPIFNWNEYPEAEYYVLKFYNEALILLYQSQRISANRFTVPPEAFEKIEENSICFWMVKAYSGSEKIAESDLWSFKLIVR